MNSEFEERSVRMKNDFEKTLSEKNQVFILIIIISIVQMMVSSKLL